MLYSKIITQKMQVLITDGELKHSLAAMRTLASKGHDVYVMSSYKYAVCFFSVYCKKKIIIPSDLDKNAYFNTLIRYIERYKIDVCIPISYKSNLVASEFKTQLQKSTKINIADFDKMNIAANKDASLKYAEEIGIPVPRKYNTLEEVKSFPIVAKGIKDSGEVLYLNSKEDLNKVDLKEFVLQEYIEGKGYGFYGLFTNGQAKAVFMHKRLREYPSTGGSSTKCKSIYCKQLEDLGVKLMGSLNWDGVAMVEFKKDIKDGKFKLIEINPKFWGSLDLCIAAGMSFPNLLCDIDSLPNKTLKTYNINTVFRWPFPDDLLHTIDNPKSIINFIIDFFNLKIKNNLFILDPFPTLVLLYETFYIIKSNLLRGSLRQKHGKPIKKSI